MKPLITPILLLLAGLGIATPVKALTDDDAAKLSIGVQVLTCVLSDGCYGSRGYQPSHYYNNPSYRYPQPYNYNKNHHHTYREEYRRNPHYEYNPRIVPYKPQYRYTPPYSGYYFKQNQYPYRGDVRGQINQIYRQILRRDCDEEGYRTYQDRYNNGWSLEDIRRDIYQSYEAQTLRRY